MSRPILRAALAAGLLLQGCAPEDAFVGVDAVKTDAGVVLLVSRTEFFSIWRIRGESWSKLGERSGKAQACAWHEGKLWVFHRKSISTYTVSEDGIEWTNAADGPFDWRVQAAHSDGRLWVCGVAGGRVRSGLLRGEDWAELPPGPEVSPAGRVDILAEGDGALIAFSHKGVQILKVSERGEWETVSSRQVNARAVALAPGGETFIQARSRRATCSILWESPDKGIRSVGSGQRSVFRLGWALSTAGRFLYSSSASELRAYAREGDSWKESGAPDELKGTPDEIRIAEFLIVLGLATVTGVLVFVARLRRLLRGVREPPHVAVAPWAVRGLAWAIDSGAVLLVSLVLTFALFGRDILRLEYADARVLLLTHSWHGLSCVYCLVFELVWGVTPGKRLLALQAVMEDGSRLTNSAAVTRNLVRIIDQYPLPVAPIVGLASMMLTSRQQRLGDLVAGTVVVRGRRK